MSNLIQVQFGLFLLRHNRRDSVFHAATAIRSAKDHEDTIRGLSFRHFVVGGLVAALLIATVLYSLGRLTTLP